MRGHRTVLWACFLALVVGGAAQAVNTSARYLTVTKSGITVPIPDADVRMKMGQRLPFIQETRHAYIAFYEDLQGQRLVAFPKRTRKKDGVAWLTKDHEIVFAKSVKSITADLYLVAGENINILDQDSDTYEVIVVRNEHRIPLTIPLDIKGLVLHETVKATQRVVTAKKPKASARKTATKKKIRKTTTQTRKPKPTKRATPSLPPPPSSVKKIDMAKGGKPQSKKIRVEFVYPDIFPPEPETPEPAPIEELAIVEEPLAPTNLIEDVELADADEMLTNTNEAEMITADTELATTEAGTTNETELAAESEIDEATATNEVVEIAEIDLGPVNAPPAPREGGFLQYFTINWTTLQILLLFILAEGYIYWRHKKHQKDQGGEQKATTYATSFSSVGESSGHMFMQASEDDDKHFSGQLGSFPMAQLLKFLHNAKETGTLSITNATDSTISQMFIDNGEVINAFSVDKTGIEAVRTIEDIKSGTFTFTRGEIEAEHRVIEESTEEILQELGGEPKKAAAKFDLKSFLNRKGS